MSLLYQLSSQVGESTQTANRRVVAQCLANPALVPEIADGLKRTEPALLGDCAEVLMQVAEQRPDLVAPYAKSLAALLRHKTTRVRWESMHALAVLAAHLPKQIAALLPQLAELIRSDPSVIVRDYAVQAVGNYAGTGKAAAEKAYPILKEALTLWEGKQAGHALRGLANAASAAPRLGDELRAIGHAHLGAGRGVVRKAAKQLMKATEAREG